MVVFDPEQGKLNLYSQILKVDEKHFAHETDKLQDIQLPIEIKVHLSHQ